MKKSILIVIALIATCGVSVYAFIEDGPSCTQVLPSEIYPDTNSVQLKVNYPLQNRDCCTIYDQDGTRLRNLN
jgi:hypothetical protein